MTDSVILSKLDSGKLFYYKNVFEYETASPGTKSILIKTPSEPIIVYFKSRFSANTEIRIAINEDVAVGGEGDVIPIRNADRSCGIESDTKLFSNSTGVTGGVNIWPAKISAKPATPVTDNPISAPVTTEMMTPIRCKQGTYYNVEMEKINSEKGYVDIYMWWYEHGA
jgi:hypothetical protein